MSIRKKVPRYRNIHVCYARRLSVSQSAPLESLSPSLSLSCLLFLPLAFFFLRGLAEVRHKGAAGKFEEDARHETDFPFTSDAIRFGSRVFDSYERARNKINPLNLGAGERLSRESQSPLEACRHTSHSSFARRERPATARMRATCRVV